ncbi:restriction endonuclease subunit S [Pantoea sp. B65]|uniref:restriction endonuclease subunit S n=1 Tax=Pantoea sp. B65 TaxID=2813359 RepID=UPI0039B422A4
MSTLEQVEVMDKYQPYLEYKESGIAWLRGIPVDWDKLTLKYALERTITDGPHETPVFIDQGVPFMSVDSIQNNQLVFDGCRYISKEDHKRFAKKCLPKRGDLLLGKAASVGKIAHVTTDQEFNVWSPLAVIRVNPNKYDSRFLYYCFQSLLLQYQCQIKSNSNTQANLGMGDISNLQFVAPTLLLQRTIAAFLDYETARIDRLIAQQQRLIELLKEKRQAVISHAVTKGINPDAPMKESGVEWLGQVPEHWSSTRIGWCCQIGNGCTPSRDKPEYWSEGTYPWLNSSKVNDLEIVAADQFVTKTALSACSLPIVPAGSIVMAITGEGKTRGSVAITFIEATLSQHLSFMTVTSCNVLPDYLLLWLESQYQKIRFESEGWGSTKAAITCSDIKAYPLPEPPLDEQLRIVNYVKEKKLRFGKLIERSEYMVTQLRDRRTALISAAVTGKIDLRGWTQPGEVAA